MKRLIHLAADHPWLVLLALAFFTALAATQLGKLRIQVSAESMLEKGTPAIFDQAKLEPIREVVRALQNVPQVTGTSSLFNATNLKNIDGTIHTRPYLQDLPTTPEEVAALQADAIRNPLALGNLISEDGQTLAINVFFSRPANDPQFDRTITEVVEALIDPLREHVETVYQVGVAAMRSDLTDKIRADQQVFLPLSVAVLLITLVVSLRRATAAVMPLITAGVSVIWTLGFMA